MSKEGEKSGFAHHPVWSSVIASGIVAAATYALDWWPAIRDALAFGWAWLMAATPTPNWVLCLLAIPAFLAAILLGVFVWDRFHPSPPAAEVGGPHWSSYRSDNIAGVKWEWGYTRTGTISGLTCFCPLCDFQIYPEQSGFGGAGVRFSCDNCHSRLGEYNDARSSLKNFVERTILHRIKTGSWKQSIKD